MFSPKLILKRLLSPKKSVLLLISPFIDIKLKKLNNVQQDRILANSLRVVVNLSREIQTPVVLDKFILGSDRSKNNEAKLSSLFDQYGSDKSRNGYHIFYQQILDELLNINDREIRIFEIGLGTNNIDVPSNMGIYGKPGASLRAFRDYSTRICVIGADVDRRVLFQEQRIETYFVNQLHIETLQPLLSKIRESHLIIDDGLHTSEANLNVLLVCIEIMKSGAWIVIEDIAKTKLNLNLWGTVSKLLDQFDSVILDLPNTYIFVAKKK